MFTVTSLLLSLALCSSTLAQTYLPGNAPAKTQQGQTGTNQCGTGNNQTSQCQNAYINSVDDFCVYGPPEPGPNSGIGSIERIAVAYCIKGGYGTRLIPDGAITGAHFVQTPDFVQITGVGDLTKINIPAGDSGGEMDPHGADGNGNPIGGLVFSSAFGQLQQIPEWTNFMSAQQFCLRACKPGPRATQFCQHIYDVMGCAWNMPANYAAGTFEKCSGDSGEPMGVYGASTFQQGQPVTPAAHPAPPSSSCVALPTISNGFVATSAAASTTPTPTSPAAAAATTSQPSATAAGAKKNGAAPLNMQVATSLASLGLLTVGFITVLF